MGRSALIIKSVLFRTSSIQPPDLRAPCFRPRAKHTDQMLMHFSVFEMPRKREIP
jgi:hypothetical protein